MRSYYCINHSKNGEEWDKYLESRKNRYVSMQYEYGLQDNKGVSERWNRFTEIKIGDVLFLQNGYKIYAWGYAVPPRKINKKCDKVSPIILKAGDIISIRDHGEYRSDGKSKAYIIFDDCECFYENLEDGKNGWGQRIDVDEWRDYNEDGIPYVPVSGRGVTKGIEKKQAEEYVNQLKGTENFKFEDEPMKYTNIDTYRKLLEANKNIIFTGAPGTGKTYLAKDIASMIILKKEFNKLSDDEQKEFNEYCGFVQFHPSYDYTDFVEGLRPVKNEENENICFERQDGIFKEFCKKALKNIKDSKKDSRDIAFDKVVKEKLEDFAGYIENETVENGKYDIEGISGRQAAPIIECNYDNNILTFKVKTKNDAVFAIKRNIDGLTEMCKEFFKKKSTKWTYRSFRDEILGKGTKGFHTYYYGFLKAFYDKYSEEINNIMAKSNAEKIEKRDYIFIIDEINRGEISKIFGELFFSIDPGYRGEKGKIETQYSNLIEDDDEFREGFYVPENVYIIGTMNDIDRSVESMDFAIRRRFAWVEIEASKQTAMLDVLENSKEEAIKRMNALNNAIEKTEGLSKAYHIGPAYFLKLENYDGDFDDLWKYHIKGLLDEYLRGLPEHKEKTDKLQAAYNLTTEESVEYTKNSEENK